MHTKNLTIDPEKTTHTLVDFIRSEISGAGYTRAVVGLSGGIDSALACALATRALGPLNVLAVRLPYRTSSPDSLEHAQLLIDALGVPSTTIPITEMVDPYFAHFPDASRTRRGNAMARARMIVLYDQSEVFHGLVVGTGNKTESLLGYSTLYGDAACALNPLGDLYKTQVRQLAHFLSIPTPVIEKAPSADLWANQTDEGELGFTYAEVDRLLYLMVDQRLNPADCVTEGFAEPFVRAVVQRILRNNFKRTLPPVARLSDGPVETRFDYLRTWNN